MLKNRCSILVNIQTFGDRFCKYFSHVQINYLKESVNITAEKVVGLRLNKIKKQWWEDAV